MRVKVCDCPFSLSPHTLTQAQTHRHRHRQRYTDTQTHRHCLTHGWMDFKLDVEHRVSGGGWRLLRHNSMFVHPRIPHLRHNRHRLLLVKDRNALARNCRHKNSSSSSWARGVGCERSGIVPASYTHRDTQTRTHTLSLSLAFPMMAVSPQEKGLTHSLQCGCCVCSRTLCPVTARPVPTHQSTKQRVSKGRHPFQQVPTRGASSEQVQRQSTHTHTHSHPHPSTPIHPHTHTHTPNHKQPSRLGFKLHSRGCIR